MTIKDVIENVKQIIFRLNWNFEKNSITWHEKQSSIKVINEILPDLEKANELQTEMIELLIEMIKRELYNSPNDYSFYKRNNLFIMKYVKFIESIKNKSWENIIKDGE
jgi:hypothetical protein